jgi:phosphatidylethanolamine-binding protein (PEBP) family uncharacterized protein
MEIKYNNIIVSGQFLTPEQTKNKPIVSLKQLDTNKYYTLIMNDPDAVAGNRIHWLIINIKGNKINNGQTIFEYDGPHPPKGSGIHTYHFTLFEQEQLTNSNLKQDSDRYINMIDLTNQLGINGKEKYSVNFKSSYTNGGKRRKTKRRRLVKRKKTRTKY